MAPTEILVHQHVRKFQEYLNPVNINVAMLTGSTPNKVKKEIGAKKLVDSEAELVWEANGYSSSPFKPYWKVIINGETAYVTQEGDVILPEEVIQEDGCNGADIDGDGLVGGTDYSTIISYWGQSCKAPKWCDGADINKDGLVSGEDLNTILSNWGRSDC